MEKKLNILVCPLDWGLGHASRDIPIIHEFFKRGHNVIVAGSKSTIELLRNEFPNIEYEPFSSLKITYPSKGSMAFHLFKLFPKMLFSIKKEHCHLKKIIKKYKIDLVISDNRFGLWSKAAYSVFITHQVMIKMPKSLQFAEYLIYRINRFFIYKYHRCWIPDNENMPYIAGDLSHKYSLNGKTSFIGLLSRFNNEKDYEENLSSEKFEIIAIISGPEPERTKFEQLLLKQMQQLECKCLIVKGKPTEIQERQEINNIVIISHLNTEQMRNAIKNSTYIISRSGYTTIMDLIALKRSAILVPTPGQTEQEYLAEYYSVRKMFVEIKQEDFNIKDAIAKLSVYSNFYLNPEENLLTKEIERIEKQLLEKLFHNIKS